MDDPRGGVTLSDIDHQWRYDMSSRKTENHTTGPADQQDSGRGRKIGIFKMIVLAVVAIVVVFVVIVAMQPSEFRIERSATIPAPAEFVFSQVNDFHNWEAWSPWAKLDPAVKNSFEGPEAGPGAIFKWSGNDKVGEGTMTLTESRPNDLIRIKLDFVRPFEDTSTAEFTFKLQGNQTLVTWTMFGRKNFIGKAVCLFMNMDKTVGGEFEKGLAQMNAAVEAAARKSAR